MPESLSVDRTKMPLSATVELVPVASTLGHYEMDEGKAFKCSNEKDTKDFRYHFHYD